MPPIASGQITGDKSRRSQPNPHTNPASRASNTPMARPVSAIQISRACLWVGGGRAISVRKDSALTELARFFGGGADGADQGAANTGLFQFVQALDGGAAG